MAFKINAPFHLKDPNDKKLKQKSQVTIDGEAGREADDKARKNKTGIYAPKQKKTREKGKQALEDGNTSKAMRLKRRERRLKRRIAKKSNK